MTPAGVCVYPEAMAEYFKEKLKINYLYQAQAGMNFQRHLCMWKEIAASLPHNLAITYHLLKNLPLTVWKKMSLFLSNKLRKIVLKNLGVSKEVCPSAYNVHCSVVVFWF